MHAYSEPCVTPAYSEPWYIQNQKQVYSEPCQTFAMKLFAKIVNSYSCFRKLKLFSQYQLFTFSTF